MHRRELISNGIRGLAASVAGLLAIGSARGATVLDRVAAAGELRVCELNPLSSPESADIEYRIVTRGADGSGITTDPTQDGDYDFLLEQHGVLAAEIKATGGSIEIESRLVGPWVARTGANYPV